MLENFQLLGTSINGAFYFVLNKIISLQDFFIREAWNVAETVLLIALLSAALNYLFTKEGFKENLFKIMKAFIFFWIVITAYPRVIGWITTYTYTLAYNSVGKDVKKYFDDKLEKMTIVVSENTSSPTSSTTYRPLARQIFQATPDRSQIFSNMLSQPQDTPYKIIPPAAAVQVMLLIAQEAFDLADAKKEAAAFGGLVTVEYPDFSKVLKGLVCGFFIIFTGVFALLEYLICLIEFMLVAGVGVILFPLSIWEGSKFMSEKYIGAVVGFFMKLLFCNLAIFLLLYGFISLFATLANQGFTGSPDQFCYILFICLLFFYICKSAPGIAQSLLTGAPSLSASGAISAAGGAVAAAAAVGGLAQKAAVGATETVATAGSTAKSVLENNGGVGNAAIAFLGSVGKDVGSSVLNKSLGLQKGGIENIINNAGIEGSQRGEDYMNIGNEDIPQQSSVLPSVPIDPAQQSPDSASGGGTAPAPAAPAQQSPDSASGGGAAPAAPAASGSGGGSGE